MEGKGTERKGMGSKENGIIDIRRNGIGRKKVESEGRVNLYREIQHK